jgi:SulP family sulfate permease
MWARGYRRAWLGPDLVAGAVASCVVVPQAIAYASLAGLPVQLGLYAALVGMLVYALLGSSRPLSVSVTSTISIITATAVAGSKDPAATAALLAIVAGVLLLVAGVVRLGFLADLISLPILSGYKAGIGLVILSSQLGKVLGIPVDGDGFFENVADVLRGLDDVNGAALALGGATIVLLLVLPRLVPGVPAPLVAVAAGIAVVAALEPDVDVVGTVPAGLPGFDVPAFDGWRDLVPAAGGIALMAAVESLAAARALARRDDPPVNADRELRALGWTAMEEGIDFTASRVRVRVRNAFVCGEHSSEGKSDLSTRRSVPMPRSCGSGRGARDPAGQRRSAGAPSPVAGSAGSHPVGVMVCVSTARRVPRHSAKPEDVEWPLRLSPEH